ncbi:subclass B1 metallo-beta-lactamase [Chitinophaga sp. HK235]|uniref:subclass B1 metallo-beta-lactamase n=1 Tax=Chitinophaga sp. HK235 TaxID=2952571 RepID=UPI001BA4599F|nr:subclass B1 metallo-beta-lactamase [Chitinophaga sp. HK235]
MKIFKYILGASLCLGMQAANAQHKSEEAPLKISHLAGNCYVYTTIGQLSDGSRYPSNSMYVVTEKGVVMIDVPWDTTQLVPLLDQIKKQHGKAVIACIATHFHEDRTAGLNALAARGIKTYSTAHTLKLCKDNHKEEARYVIPEDTTFRLGDRRLQVFYPGPGHAPDNIVVWVPEDKVLYGGCFIKSTDAADLGNLSDADPKAWTPSMLRLKAKFPNPVFTVPGHGELSNKDKACNHTLELIQTYNAGKNK